MNKKQKKVLIRIIITAVLLVALKLLIEFSVLPETGRSLTVVLKRI